MGERAWFKSVGNDGNLYGYLEWAVFRFSAVAKHYYYLLNRKLNDCHRTLDTFFGAKVCSLNESYVVFIENSIERHDTARQVTALPRLLSCTEGKCGSDRRNLP